MFLVRERGLEPPRLAPPVPKTGVFTNYTTRAFYRNPVGLGHEFFVRRRSQKLSTPTQLFLLL